MAFTKPVRRQATSTTTAKSVAIPKEVGHLRQLRFAELDKEFVRQARELSKLARALRDKFRDM